MTPSGDENTFPPPLLYKVLLVVAIHTLLSAPISISLGQCLFPSAVNGKLTSFQEEPLSVDLYNPY